jgi:hypothetical protein
MASAVEEVATAALRRRRGGQRRRSSAQLLRRVFGIEILARLKCSRVRRVLTAIYSGTWRHYQTRYREWVHGFGSCMDNMTNALIVL